MATSIEERRKKDRDRKREKYNTDPKWKKKDRSRSNKSHMALYKRNKTKAIEYTGGLRCHNPDCGWKGDLLLCQIDFHHVIKQNKTKSFAQLFRNHKWETCKEEIDNCKAIPLCSNCHMAEEHG